MFTFSEMLVLAQSESSFGACVCQRRPARLHSDWRSCSSFCRTLSFVSSFFAFTLLLLLFAGTIFCEFLRFWKNKLSTAKISTNTSGTPMSSRARESDVRWHRWPWEIHEQSLNFGSYRITGSPCTMWHVSRIFVKTACIYIASTSVETVPR